MDARAVNREHWDALAAAHGAGRDRSSDVEAPARGERGLPRAEAEAVGDVAGLVDLHRGGGILTHEDDGVYRLRLAGTALPVLSTRVAAKPAAPAR